MRMWATKTGLQSSSTRKVRISHFSSSVTFIKYIFPGIGELEKGLLLEFSSGQANIQKECQQAHKLQHKMKLNLDMAKKRLDYHLNLENRKSQQVLKHLSLPKNMKPPTHNHTDQKIRKEDKKVYSGPYTPQPTRKTHKRCLSSSDNHSVPRTRTNSIPTSVYNNKKNVQDKFMKIVMSEIIESGAGTSFNDIAGQKQAKQALQESVILPALR